MKEVTLLGIQLEATTGSPVLVLEEAEGRQRLLPLFIGAPEAASIALALSGAEPPRPLTHDLLVHTIDAVGGHVERAEVTGYDEGMFLAELVVAVPGAEHRIDARPSDAIAVAIRTGAPVFVDDDVLDEAGAEPPPPEPEDGEHEVDEAELDEFRAFLEDLSPDDFTEPDDTVDPDR